MKRRRKILVSIAMSTDGFIARPDGDVAWLDRPGPKRDYGLGEFFKTIDTILWGRKTYDKGIEIGMKVSEFGPGVKNYLYFSPSPEVVAAGFRVDSRGGQDVRATAARAAG
jgi:hypothetical protein